MLGARNAECPNCGAPIAFEVASSHALVCKYCRFAVVRSDRDLSAIGRVADLVPTASPLSVGDEGSASGRSFRVLGRIQLDHGRGPWDEWYLGFSDGAWGWLARAEGRWYLTHERGIEVRPRWEDAGPGARLTLAGVDWVVTERGGSAVVSAEGELPYAVDPRGSGRYADLEAEGGAFATLDLGDGSEPPRFYAGRELSQQELSFKRLAPRVEERVGVQKLACPSCGAPVPIFVPSACERVGCQHCGALLDHTAGSLTLLSQLEPPPILPLIPLGARGKLLGSERTVIGFMQRYVIVDGDRYAFREYLLHADGGYSWLVEEDHHWLHVAPVATSAVQEKKRAAVYDGRTYRAYSAGNPVVEVVLGEFYWKVMAGDGCRTFDYIAPPRLLSVERTEDEITWSEGEYLERAQLVEAFGVKDLPPPTGVSAAQPNPHRARGATFVFALLALLWFLLAAAYESGGKQHYTYSELKLPAAGGAETALLLTDAFLVPRGPTTVEIELNSPINNGSVFVEASLIPEDPPGDPRVVPLLAEYYSGVEGGESWSEGSTSATQYFGRVPAGRYSFRFVGSWEQQSAAWMLQPTPPPVTLTASIGRRSPACCFGTLFLIALPWLLGRIRSMVFETRRKENENLP